MAITASLMFGLSLEKCFIDTLGESWEAEDNLGGMTTDAYSPNSDTHDFHADLTNVVSGSDTETLTTTEWSIGSPSAGTMKFDLDDPAWAASTFTDAMCFVHFTNVGASATNQLLYLLDFVTAGSTNNGLFTVQIHANGAVNLDYTP